MTAASPIRRYAAFISYNHKDRAWASWLHRRLEGYRLPRSVIGRDSPIGVLGRRLPAVFQDRAELAASANLADSVRDALGQSASLIVICSTRGAASRWVNEEVRTFAALGMRERIQCLIVPEHDAPRGSGPLPESAIFPPALTEIGIEPLAADARPSGDGRRDAFLKLVAGITAVRYDDLRQRETARRQRQLALVAGAASIGFVSMSGLAAVALLSRTEAVRQRDIARQKTVTAERTTDFVKGLFTVSDPSEAQGQQITALQVLDRGAREIDGALGQEPQVKAELMTTLSEVYLGLGSYRRANAMIRRSLSLPVAEAPVRARQLSVLGDAQLRQSHYAAALRTFDRALANHRDMLAATDPPLFARVLNGRAEALIRLARYDEANRDIADTLRIDRQHQGPRSDAVARDLETAGLSSNLAGKYDAATAYYRQALAIRLATHGRLHPRVADDQNELGTIAYMRRDAASAERYWRQTLAADEVVLGPDHPDVGLTLNNLALVLVEQRKFAEARPMLERSLHTTLAQRSANSDDLSFVYYNLARSFRGLGDLDSAAANFARGLAVSRLHHDRMEAPILTDLAEVKCLKRDFRAAAALLALARPIMVAAYPDDPWRPAWVDHITGFCLTRQGDRAGGTALLAASAPAIAARWPERTMYGWMLGEHMAAGRRE